MLLMNLYWGRSIAIVHTAALFASLPRLMIIIVLFAVGVPSTAQNRSGVMQEEILKLEKEFGQAIVKNGPDAIAHFLADDWIIIDPDGGIIDRSSFLAVIRSGALSHQVMDSEDVRVRIYGDAAAVTALTTAKGKYMGQEFTSQERATDMFVKKDGRWQCVVSQLTRFTKK
jgi:ketosteroid isomerase-like protein